MTEINHVLRASTRALIEEVNASRSHFNDEVTDAINAQLDLVERKKVLEIAMDKTNSGAAQVIMEEMVNELQGAITKEKDRQRHSENNREYYTEIKAAIDEALKEL